MEWPKEPYRMAQDVLEPLLKAYGRILHKLPANYEGLDISSEEATTELRAKSLFESIERDRYRMLHKLFYFAFLLGMEQGRRKHRWEMLGVMTRLVKEAETAGANLSWLKVTWDEEVGRPWPGKRT